MLIDDLVGSSWDVRRCGRFRKATETPKVSTTVLEYVALSPTMCASPAIPVVIALCLAPEQTVSFAAALHPGTILHHLRVQSYYVFDDERLTSTGARKRVRPECARLT